MEILTTSDMEAFVRPCCVAFGIQPTPAVAEHQAKLMDPTRAHVAYADGEIVGAAGAYTHTLAVPGGVVAAAAVNGVGVLPSHRRRGIFARLQETQLADFHERGEPIAYLWATEGNLYQRFGYGMASQSVRASVRTEHGKLRGSPDRLGNVRIIEQEDAHEHIAALYGRIWRERPGMFLRNENWWRVKRLSNAEMFYAVWEASAYAIYRVKFDRSSVSGEIEVVESLSESAEGHRQIWRYLLNMDLVTSVSAPHLAIDDPLIFMLADPQKAKLEMRTDLWVRIIDVENALKARSLGSGSIVVHVIDTHLPHNAGTWKVSAESISRVSSSPDLVIDIADLGSTYLSGFTFAELARGGRVREQVPGSIKKADQMFSWDRKPWCPESF